MQLPFYSVSTLCHCKNTQVSFLVLDYPAPKSRIRFFEVHNRQGHFSKTFDLIIVVMVIFDPKPYSDRLLLKCFWNEVQQIALPGWDLEASEHITQGHSSAEGLKAEIPIHRPANFPQSQVIVGRFQLLNHSKQSLPGENCRSAVPEAQEPPQRNSC